MSKNKASSSNKKAPSTPSGRKPFAGAPTTTVIEAGPAKDRTVLYMKIALFAITFLVFANGIPNRYNLDDELYTTNAMKAARHGLTAIPMIFTRNTFSDNENSFEFRPVAMLSFVLQFMWLGNSPAISHLINVLLYALTCLMLFSLLLKWFKKAHAWYAFAVCVFFAIHPLHTEVVDSAKSRDEILALFFTVLSFLVVWRYYETKKLGYLLSYPFIFILGILSKKTTLPLIIIPFFAFYFFADMSVKKALLLCILSTAMVRGLFFLSTMSLPVDRRLFFAMENPFYVSSFSFAAKSATATYISGWYLYLHFIPFPLVFYYGYRYVPIVGWDNIRVWLSLLIYVALGIYILLNLRKKAIPAFGAIWFMLNIFIFSNIFRPSPGMMAERFMYAASFGFSIMFCWVLFKLFKVDPAAFKFNAAGKRLAAVFVIICLCYGARSVERNIDWKNKFTLYTHDIKYTGESTKANMMNGELMLGLSNAYRQKAMAFKKDNDMTMAKLNYDSSVYYLNVAKENFKKAIEITPNMGSAINNLAVIYFNLDSMEQAKMYINMALKGTAAVAAGDVALNANDRAKLNHNLGIIYFKERKIDSAIHQLGLAVYYDSTYGEAYMHLEDVLLMSHDTMDAIKVLQRYVRNQPDDSHAYTELANIAFYKKDTASAVMYCEKAAVMRKANPQVVVFLRNYFQSRNDTAKVAFYTKRFEELKRELQSAGPRGM